MSSVIDTFTPRTMLAALEQMEVPKTFLMDTFFKTEVVHDTDKIDIDIVTKSGKKMAAFVSPVLEGKVVRKRGFKTNTYSAPYIKEKTVTEAYNILKRQPGEVIYGNGATVAQRAAAELGKDMADLRDRIIRRQEWMCASALTTGTITIDGDGIQDNIDFGMQDSHKVTLLAGALWTASGGTPLDDLQEWSDLILEDSGLRPTLCVMGKDAAAAFRSNTQVLAWLDKLNIVVGKLDTQPRNYDGVKSIMTHTESGLDIVQYSGSYFDEATQADVPLIPDNMVLIGCTNAYTRMHYGVIKDLEANAAVKMFPKTWLSKDPSAQYLLVQSAPLAGLHQVDAFMVATVCA